MTIPTLTNSYTNTIPNSAAGSNTQIIAGTDYLTVNSAAGACAVAYALYLVPSSGSPTGATGTWLTISSTTGHVSVDTNTLGSAQYKVQYTQASVVADSVLFTVNVNCPILS
jgi:hypothetical protein